MGTVFVNAFGFLFMILLGFTLKRTGLFSVEDSGLLSKLVLKITLPMAIIPRPFWWQSGWGLQSILRRLGSSCL